MIIEESDIALVAAGNMLITAQAVREKLKEKGYNITVVNERFIKPVEIPICWTDYQSLTDL